MDKRNIEAVYPLSPTQRGLLLYLVVASGQDRPSNAFFEQYYVTFHGALDPEHWRAAWEHVVARHSSLRSVFLWERRDAPIQIALRHIDLPFVFEDWRDRSKEQQEADFQALLEDEQAKGFQLDRGPMIRIVLIRTGEDEHRFLWCFSHLLLDGWSIAMVFGEALRAHAAIARGETPDLGPVKPYRAYIAWLQDQEEAQAEAYWRRALDGSDGATSLPMDRDPGAPMTRHSARLDDTSSVSCELSSDTAAAIDQLCRDNRITANAFFQGVWGLLLARTAGEDDVLWGSVVSGRTPQIPGVETIAGLFINALPVRAEVDESSPFVDWVHRLYRQLAEQRQFEYIAVESIQEWLGVPRDRPLFESLFLFENYPESGGESPLRIEAVGFEETTNYPLAIYVTASATGVHLRFAWHDSRFAESDVRALLERYADWLARLAAEPGRRIADIGLVDSEEQERLLDLASAATNDWPTDDLVFELIAAQAESTPDAVAITQVGSDDTLTYAELVGRARALGRRLRGAGVGPDRLVAVSMDRSPTLITALLGVLEAGGAYLPIDPDYPADRIAFMLEDSAAGVLLTTTDRAGQLPASIRDSLDVILLDGELESADGGGAPSDSAARPEPHHLAYVIYTSGSTGRPKGVLVEHRNLTHYTVDSAATYGLRPGARALQFATISFDTSAEEIYPALISGATLVLRDDAMIGAPDRFLDALDAERIDLLNLPTAYWHELCAELADTDRQLPDSLRGVVIGGEAAVAERLEQWCDAVERSHPVALWNTYGPTETTIVCTRADLSTWRPSEHDGEVPIGRPIANARAYVVDGSLRPRPIGLPGELLIGGPGVTRGYLDRPALTAERFVADPFTGEGRLYRTGDRVAWTADGTLLFRGRVDEQVKIRGFRIEPGEVESALLRHEAVRDAVVVVAELGGESHLVAYVVGADDEALDTDRVRDALGADLPDFMTPSQIIRLDTLPKTPSGKVDRRALPAPEAMAGHAAYEPPRSDVEEILAGLWAELLGLDRVGLRDDFFQLGGHSLLVGRLTSRLRKVLGVELPLVAVFDHPTFAELAAEIERLLLAGDDAASTSVDLPPIEKLPRDGSPLPLSYPQERVWVLNQLDPTSVAYNFQLTMWFVGPLDIDALQYALTEIVRRHEVFHCTFPEIDGDPGMVVEGPWTVELPQTDISHLADEAQRAEADRLLEAAVKTPFDVTKLPLVRWQLVRLGEERHMLIQVEHHFVHDGWSLGVLLKELKAIYSARVEGLPSPLPELEIQYGDFAAWQRTTFAGERLGSLVDHWRKRLDGMPMVLDLPTDHPRPNRPSTRGDARMFALPDELYAGLRRFGRENGYTLYMTMLAAFYSLMYRYTGATDMGVGAGVANRRQKEQESIIGMMVNTVVMRGDLSGEPTFAELLKRTREVSIDAFVHQDMPFERLVEAMQPERHVSRNPIFQAMFSFHDAQVPELELAGGTTGHFLVRTNQSAKTDLNVIVAPQAEQEVGQEVTDGRPRLAVVTWEYNRELFEPETIDLMIEHYLTLAADAIAHPEKKLFELDMVPADKASETLLAHGRPSGDYPRDATAHRLFQAIATEHATSTAVSQPTADGRAETTTYAELQARSSRLARRLREAGVGLETPVALALERSIDLIVAELAVLEAGGFFVPLDPAYPAERLATMLDEVDARVLISHRGLDASFGERIQSMTIIDLDAERETIAALDDRPLSADPNRDPGPDNLAYVMFTSGSTGRPKGVAVPHRAIVRLVRSDSDSGGFADFDANRVWLGFAPASFDASTLEIWAPLLHGGRLELAPAGRVGLEELTELVAEREVDSLWLTAGLFHQLVDGEHLRSMTSVRQLLAGGDVLDPERVRGALDQLPDGARVINGYGPTENTTFTTCHPMSAADELPAGRVPIGQPIPGTGVAIVDDGLRPQPEIVPGELLATGDGLARGYYGQPALTAERFVPDPTSNQPGARAYRTGDRARWRPDGTIQFFGRFDFQAKIRGFRVEPGEVRAALAEHPDVQDAVVVVRDDHGDKILVGYAVLDASAPGSESKSQADTSRDLKAFLAGRLPSHLVPTAIVVLDRLPLDPNGKVDRRSLPAPNLTPASETVENAEPRNPLEERLVGIFSELLSADRVGIFDDFFELGGHSLLATRLVSRLRNELSVEVKLSQIFEMPTIAKLAEWLPTAGRSAVEAIEASDDLDKVVPSDAESMADQDLDALLGDLLDTDDDNDTDDDD